ncbi:hypothetical protein MUB42_07130 (plasmid) [Apilactobacillus kunkeei]|nr:hypothetical protein MUB42_07130 [Apilactobacillus kunkeei]
MKKQTKNILTKLALVAAPFAVAATITTSAVSANADGTTFGDWVMTPAEKANMQKADNIENDVRKSEHATQAEEEAQGAALAKKQDAQFNAHIARNKREFGDNTSLTPAKKASTTATKKVVKKHVTKKTTKKKAVKKHAKKVAKKRFVKKHASKKLLRSTLLRSVS